MEKLYLEPVQAGYATEAPQDEVLRSQVPGGASRYRADVLGGSSVANLAWVLTDGEYQYLWAFFRAKTDRSATPFLIDLVLEDPAMTERTVHYVPGSLKLDSKQGDVYFASAQVEVDALEADDAFDNSVAEIYPIVDGDYAGYFAFLSPIPNIYWPDNYDISLGVVRGAGLDGHLGLLDAILEAWPER